MSGKSIKELIAANPELWRQVTSFADLIEINLNAKQGTCPVLVNGDPFPFCIAGDEEIRIDNLREDGAAPVVWIPILARNVEVNS